MRTALRLVLAAMLAPLLGCAAQAPAHPAAFPDHSEQPPFALHWRVDRDAGRVTAVGIIEIGGRIDRLVDVTLEFQGLDRAGRGVSRGLTRTPTPGWGFARGVTWPFTVWLRPTGQEERFTVRVADYTERASRLN